MVLRFKNVQGLVLSRNIVIFLLSFFLTSLALVILIKKYEIFPSCILYQLRAFISKNLVYRPDIYIPFFDYWILYRLIFYWPLIPTWTLANKIQKHKPRCAKLNFATDKDSMLPASISKFQTLYLKPLQVASKIVGREVGFQLRFERNEPTDSRGLQLE